MSVKFIKNIVRVKKKNDTEFKQIGAFGFKDEDAEAIRSDLEELESEVDGKASTESVQNLNASKLSKPSSDIEVGKYFRVASIDSEGNPVLEACDLPVATSTTKGIARFYEPYGIKMTASDGLATVVSAENAIIDTRASSSLPNKERQPIVPKNLDYAVKAAMCDGKGADWTASEQLAARQRIGVEDYWELIDTIAVDEAFESKIITTCPNGEAYNFKKIIITATSPKTTFTTFPMYVSAYYGTKFLTLYDNQASSTTYFRRSSFEFDLCGNVVKGRVVAQSTGYGTTQDGVACDPSSYKSTSNMTIDDSATSIFKLLIKTSSSYTIPAGYLIKIYAVRA